jgi:acyl-CoA reductase-like NAD-dependent aldehyde dehydrogenase
MTTDIVTISADDTSPVESPTMTIDGRPVDAESRIEVINPSTAEVFTTVPDCSTEQFEQAVRGAEAAFAPWRRTPLAERQELLLKACESLEANLDELARLVALENGKPLANARGEIGAALGHWRAYAEIEFGDEVLRSDDERHVVLRRVPLGVVGAITAWNYPILLAAFKLGPALLAGNTVVLKPSPFTPVATLLFGRIVNEVFPPGVVQVLSGGDELGRWITAHPDIAKVSFTGSVPTGRAIMAASAPTLKRLTLELGGNDAGIVLPGTDIGKRADDLYWAGFSNCGQVCAGLKRLYVHESQIDEVAAALAAVAATIKVGDGFDEGVQTGPIQNKPQFDHVRRLVDEAVDAGAEIVYQGEVPETGGYFFPITIVRGAAEGSALVDEEPFGPVLPLITYTDVDDAVTRANATDYGLGASVWGEDPDQTRRVAEQLEAGTVWINVHPSLLPTVPFGGRKQSGIGVEASRLGIEAYTDISVLHIKT